MKVSAIVTCYNYGRYLGGCLDSVWQQTRPCDELVVVDDGSTDETAAVLRPLVDRPNVTIIHQANAGQAAAKNAGARRASGELLAFLDADDRWDPHKLEYQLPQFTDETIGVVYSRARYIDATGQPVAGPPAMAQLAPAVGEVTAALFVDNFVPFSSALVRRSCFEAAGGFDVSLAMGIDWDLWLTISRTHRFSFVDEPLLVYRIGHAGQMSRDQATRQACADRIMSRFLERNPGLLPRAVVRRAYGHTWVNRAYSARSADRALSSRLYWRAIRANPFEWRAYSGLAKNGWLLLSGSQDR